jgi:hypothetical protein
MVRKDSIIQLDLDYAVGLRRRPGARTSRGFGCVVKY